MKKIFILLGLLSFVCFSFVVEAENENSSYIVKMTEVYDSFNNPRYSLRDYSDGGYAIYDNYNNEILEKSYMRDSSPYLNQEGKFYYFGLNKYIVFKNSEYYDIYTKEVVDIKKYKDVRVVEKEIMTINQTFIPASYEVPFSEYFKHLDGVKNPFAENKTGDYGYIAATILLGYLATYFNSDILCEHYMTKNTTYDSDGNIIDVGAPTQKFKDEVLKENIFVEKSNATDIEFAVERYLDNVGSISYNGYVARPIPKETITIKLKEGIPLLLFDEFLQHDTDEETGFHAVVVYGISRNDNFIAHLGYKNRSNVIVSYLTMNDFDLFIESAYFVNEVSHKHGNLLIKNGDYYCMLCEQKVECSINVNYKVISSRQHETICATCGDSMGISGHKFTAADKGRVCIECNYFSFGSGEIIHPHSWS